MTEAVGGISIQLSRLRPRGKALLRVKLCTSTGMHLPCLRRPPRKGRCLAFPLPCASQEMNDTAEAARVSKHCGRTEGCVVHVQQFMSRVSNTGRRFVAHSWSSRVPVRHVDHRGIHGCE